MHWFITSFSSPPPCACMQPHGGESPYNLMSVIYSEWYCCPGRTCVPLMDSCRRVDTQGILGWLAGMQVSSGRPDSCRWARLLAPGAGYFRGLVLLLVLQITRGDGEQTIHEFVEPSRPNIDISSSKGATDLKLQDNQYEIILHLKLYQSHSMTFKVL